MRPRLETLAVVLGLALVGGSACPSAPPSTTDDDDGSTTSGTSTGPAGTTFSAPDACMASSECEEGLSCVAPYDPALDPPVGAGACIPACIEIDDLTRWCFDDDACCGETRCNEVDGFCEPGPGSDDGTTRGTDSGTTEGPGETDDTSTGPGTTGSTDSGTTGSPTGSTGSTGGSSTG